MGESKTFDRYIIAEINLGPGLGPIVHWFGLLRVSKQMNKWEGVDVSIRIREEQYLSVNKFF